jgi:hypothetical protein
LPDGEEKPYSEPVKPVVKSVLDLAPELVQEANTPSTDGVNNPSQGSTPANPIFDPKDLVGKTFLLDPNEDGTIDCARIVELLQVFNSTLEENPIRIKFRLAVGMIN